MHAASLHKWIAKLPDPIKEKTHSELEKSVEFNENPSIFFSSRWVFWQNDFPARKEEEFL